ADGHRVARNRGGQSRRRIPEPRPHGVNAEAFPSFLKEGWREAPGWLGCPTTPPAVAGTPPHPRRGKKRKPRSACDRVTSSLRLPSFLKEGWREAPGWLSCPTTPPAGAGTPPHPRRGKKRQPRSACDRVTSSLRLPSFLKEGWREAPGWLSCPTTPPAGAGTPPHPR